MAIIHIEDISKKYRINQRKDTLRGSVSSLLSGKNNIQDEFYALKNISLTIGKGEVLGIIGKNGAGKSTLLKILSRITEPSSGRVTIDGRISSLLEVGTGFHPELSGRENIFLNGTILGMTRKEIKNRLDEIIDFSGVEKFLDTPVKHFSSGMYVRLAFSVAAHLEPEILIIDEVLSVGDAEFQKKCLGKMDDVAKGGRTVLFVSHNMGAIHTLCSSAVILEQGQIINKGNTSQVIADYLQTNISRSVYGNKMTGSRRIEVAAAEISFHDNKKQDRLCLDLTIVSKESGKCALDIRFCDNSGASFAFASLGTFSEMEKLKLNKGENQFKIEIDTSAFALGFYSISMDLTDPYVEYFERLEGVLSFEIQKASSMTRDLMQDWRYGSIQLNIKNI